MSASIGARVLILGQDQDSLGGDLDRLQAFRGDIGSLEMWDFPLTSAEVRQIASCQRRPSGSVVSLDTDDFESFGDVQEVWVDFDYFCRPQINRPYYMIYPSKIHKNENIHLCYLMNTTLPVPKDDIDNQLLYTELGLLKNMCNFPQFMLWLGIVRDNGSDQWLNMYTKTPITYSNFHSRFPKGGSAYFCGYMTNDGRWADAYCQYSRCGACLLRRTDFITMRGLCFKNRLETRFYPKGYKGGKPVFHSFHGYVIFWDEGGYQWHLYNSATKQEMASLKTRRHWLPLVCVSGQCTQKYGSDEEDCGLVNIPKGYIQYLAPRGPRNSPLPLIPIVTLVRVAHVDNINMAIDVEFVVSITWRDDRLSFQHLSTSGEKFISKEDVTRMWMPQFQILDLVDAKYKLLENIVIVSTSKGAQLPVFNSIKRDPFYPGKDNNITSSSQHTAQITCSFDLYVYPFDVQMCSIRLRLPHSYVNNVYFDVNKGSAFFTGKQDLALYTISNVHYDSRSDKTNLAINFELCRRQGLVLMTTFIPSMLLLLVSWATLFIKQEALNVRAGMALTTLLILYTLFANFSRSIPQTDIVKLAQAWQVRCQDGRQQLGPSGEGKHPSSLTILLTPVPPGAKLTKSKVRTLSLRLSLAAGRGNQRRVPSYLCHQNPLTASNAKGRCQYNERVRSSMDISF
ncbi:putative gamma-aminobutyric acid receptor subunit delta [Penaeus vannamei]|uniref:Putative gamma-aminobutyric acid receptor subunit delta n=1 Tax=Penaeus vannamei TaxID=6689 RepID=A0A3R7QU60_PENVA|nr:putative gamma-aminobutyric acid receptor subunit delta [Penaeus vannamei]